MSNSSSSSSPSAPSTFTKVLELGGPKSFTTSEGDSVSSGKYSQGVAIQLELKNQQKLARIAGLDIGPNGLKANYPGSLESLVQDDSGSA